MRVRIAGLLGLGFAVMSTPVTSALWSVENDAIIRTEYGNVTTIAVHADVTMLSPTSHGGTWLTASDGLWYLSSRGNAQAHIDTSGSGFGDVQVAAADPYDDTLWITTSDDLLLRFAQDGALEHGTTLPGVASAMAFDADQSVWLIIGGDIVHFSRDGKRLGERSLGFAANEHASVLVIDSLRNDAVVATTRGVRRMSLAGVPTLPGTLWDGEVTALTLDPRSGTVLAIVDRRLVAATRGGEPHSRFHRALDESDEPIALLYDAGDATFIVRTMDAVVRVANDGDVLARLPASTDSIVAATPFRIEPAIALMRPPDGGATSNPWMDIVMRLAARCNGSPCEVPQAYIQNIRIDAALDGVSLGQAQLNAATGEATFPQRPPMLPGLNQLAARAVDAFGHDAALDHVRVTLLTAGRNSAPVAPGDMPSAGEANAPETKAANKPPTISLTSPMNGDVFTVGTPITLTAAATDSDGSIAKVEFYRGSTSLIGTATTAPFRIVWTGAAVGTYSLTAKAFDNRNGSAVSAAITVAVVNNRLPFVTLTFPGAGSFVAAGMPVTLAASAADPDGSIATVEFFDAATSLGVAVAPPYEVLWSASVAGVHSISARATDDKGGSSDSTAVDVVVGQPPRVVVTRPPACSSLTGPVDMALSADALGSGGNVVSVEFFDSGVSLGVTNVAPWRMTLVNAAVGAHSITAKATDDHGLSTTSRASTFDVHGANELPAVSITSPIEGARFANGSTINLIAVASDTDGTVAAVEFRIGSASGSLIDRKVGSPYATTWTNVPAGSYSIVAVAYDDRNAATTSSAVHISVDANALPTVSLTAPLSNATYTAPATITISANASDGDGSIAEVDFYAGSTLLGASTSAPYTVNWNGVGAGNYSITARAKDNAGGVATSAAVAVTVASNALPVIALTAPASGSQYFALATIALSAGATDSDGTITQVEFRANGIPIGTAVAAPFNMVWDGVDAGTYAITAIATDNAGGTTTSSAVDVAVLGSPAVNIDAALDGTTIDDDNVLVRGFVSAPANAAMTVNGVVTHIDDYGRFQANDVPLTPGANAVTAVVAAQDGQTSSQTITINSTGTGAFKVHASPTEGLNSLQVTFTVENPGNIPFKQVILDLDNDGLPNVIAAPGQFVDGTLTVTATYPAGTWLATIRVYDDQDRVIYSTSKSIVVLLPFVLQGNLRAIYDGMVSRLRAGNIAGAMTAFTGAAYDKYNAIFTQLQPALASIVDQLGEIREINFGIDLAELSVVRDTSEGPKRFMIYLIRAEDGIWRIDGM